MTPQAGHMVHGTLCQSQHNLVRSSLVKLRMGHEPTDGECRRAGLPSCHGRLAHGSLGVAAYEAVPMSQVV